MLVGKHEGRRWLAQPKCRWGDSIKVDLKTIEWENVDWICGVCFNLCCGGFILFCNRRVCVCVCSFCNVWVF